MAAISIGHAVAADGTFSATGATEWNKAHAVSGATQYGIYHAATTTSIDQTAGFTFGGSAAGTGLAVPAGTAASAVSAFTLTQTRNFNTSATNYVSWAFTQTSAHASDMALAIFGGAGGATFLNGVVASTGAGASVKGFHATFSSATDRSVGFQNNGGNYQMGTFVGADLQFICDSAVKATLYNTAGRGIHIVAGTGTTDVALLSGTQTWNNAACATGVRFSITDTTSAAGALAFQVLGGAAAATNLISVSKAGKVDAPSYAVGGTNGVSFGPGLPTSITIVNGIVTAAS